MIGSLPRPLTWAAIINNGTALWIISKVLKLFNNQMRPEGKIFTYIFNQGSQNLHDYSQAQRGCTGSPSARPTGQSSWTPWSTWCCPGRSTRRPGGGYWRRSRSATVRTSSSSSETASCSSELSTLSTQTQKKWDLIYQFYGWSQFSPSGQIVLRRQFCGISVLLESLVY